MEGLNKMSENDASSQVHPCYYTEATTEGYCDCCFCWGNCGWPDGWGGIGGSLHGDKVAKLDRARGERCTRQPPPDYRVQIAARKHRQTIGPNNEHFTCRQPDLRYGRLEQGRWVAEAV